MIENRIMKCSIEAYADGGIEFKEFIDNYQDLLINENILIDNTGESYREMLQDFTDETIKEPSKFFYIELREIGKIDINQFQKCKKEILNKNSKNNSSKLEAFNQVFLDYPSRSTVAKEILKLLKDDDFENDYYKIGVFSIFSLIDLESGLKKKK